MASKTRARKALEAALEQAVTPTDRAEIANRLSLLTERESRTRARIRREKAKRPPKPAAPPRDDSGDLFELDVYPAVLTPQTPPTAAPALATPPVDDTLTSYNDLDASKRPDGFSRVLDVLEYPTYSESFPTAAFHDEIRYVDPLGFLGAPCVRSDSYSIAGGFNNERVDQERRAEEDARIAFMDKMGWRR